ncbi:hypothetical protein LTR99_010761 [Exophiala xenobiotica]|uniref:FAS1 domain-containing protein n=1 Tax=Vermiconidia calcicola TaxID=1690605 RepID=A0AAV9PQQ4_9PEZI|nr:hypothetical protein LTR92_004940 [Exophiala xenobiotica]KAK5527788.1 hypothetical protein LTR25_010919 [Vermiconidia calcicola]KAK5538166.1 hypothetical protein LTR23_007130 [Chaetothyriales sp. CCFEE 6169]KAK5216152.1 hypothetical protein LTR72_010891 [Exophiala xenobiotica]KAK5252000.1 hypothetical protein LTR40_011308 [Exophiala xenobiotica]
MSQQDIFDLEAYHFVKGLVKYSTDLTDGLRIRTVLGKDVTITRLNGSIYINAAKVIDPDYIITTGVLHLIDNAMNPNDTDARPEVANITGSPTKSSPPSSSLSTGAKAGIAVGAALGALILFGLLIFFWMRRRRVPKKQQIHQLDSTEKNAGPVELHGTESHRSELPEKPSDRPYEMDAGRPVGSELSDGTDRTR